MDKNTMQMKL